MLDKKIWIPICLLVILVGIGLFYGQKVANQEPVKSYKVVEVETPVSAPKPPPPGETHETGHWHGDEWHSQPHETHDPPVQLPPTEPVIPRGTPFANFKPDPNDDPVKAAYKRLDYIANHLNEWGDFSPRTLEIIDVLTPMPEPPREEGQGDDTIAWLEELSALRDPRSAELLIKYQMESGIMGRPVDEALVAMGPASVPGLIARLDDLSGDSYLITPLDLLDQIVAEHRSDLGGIVEHIIIPKLEAIAASDTVYQHAASRRLAQLRQ